MANFDDMKLAVEAMTGGKNTVLLDDVGMPSIMVPFSKLKNSELITGASDNTHPAFSVNGVEKDVMYVSKFLNVVVNSRAYSLPLKDPKTSINFDASVTACRAKGTGWGLTPAALWAAIALWSRKNGTMPRGNNNYGRDHAYTHEKGIPVGPLDAEGRTQRTATGSGPATWNHNWLPDGIADMNGNIYEWLAGFRLMNGEIQVIPYANCMDPEASMGASSTLWKAILADGTLTDPGASGTLKFDYLSSKLTLTTAAVTDDSGTNRSTGYTSLGLASGLTAPEILKAMTIYPDEPGGDYGGDNRYMTLTGERMPFAGGDWYNGTNAGVFNWNLDYSRSYATSAIGFRSAFCDLST